LEGTRRISSHHPVVKDTGLPSPTRTIAVRVSRPCTAERITPKLRRLHGAPFVPQCHGDRRGPVPAWHLTFARACRAGSESAAKSLSIASQWPRRIEARRNPRRVRAIPVRAMGDVRGVRRRVLCLARAAPKVRERRPALPAGILRVHPARRGRYGALAYRLTQRYIMTA